MNLSDIITKCYILALIIRDDGERLLLGDGIFEFKSSLQHFAPNIYQNDIVELQGTDGQLLAGQVRRSATQAFDGYIADGTIGKTDTEQSRRRFLGFFRKKHHYKVVYIMPDGTAVQRDRGYIVDAPAVQELYQRFPEYHIGLNFEDPNYYEYDENGDGEEIPANTALISLANLLAGGLVWDNLGAVSQEKTWLDWENGDTVGGFYQYTNGLAGAPLEFTHLYGNATQKTLSGKNLYEVNTTPGSVSGGLTWVITEDTITVSGTASGTTSNSPFFTLPTQLPVGDYAFSIPQTISYNIRIQFQEPDGTTNHYGSQITPGNIHSATNATWTTAKIRMNLGGWQANDNISISFPNRVQLEAGTQPTPYEPYVGGVPSPNPDYPQQVNVVSGEQTVKITGKNLADALGATWVRANTTMTISDDTIKLTANAGVIARACLPLTGLVEGETYTISYELRGVSIASDATYSYVRIRETSSGGNWISSNQRINVSSGFESYSITFTATSVSNPYLWIYASSSASNTNNIEIYARNIQLESGSIATDYEPYQSQSQEINLGKNLFDKSQPHTDGYFLNSSGAQTVQSLYSFSYYIPIKPNTPYTTSSGGTLGNAPARCYYDSAKNFISGVIHGNANPFTHTSPSNAVYMRESFTTGEIGSIQVEAGSTATPYAPYKTPIELAKIGTYQDYIWNDGGTWKIHKAIGKTVYTGAVDEYWQYVSGEHARFTIANSYVALAPSTGVVGAVMSDYFTPASVGNIYSGQDCSIGIHNTIQQFWIGYHAITTVEGFKTWLSTHNTTVYYALATPTDTEITDQTLIQELSAIANTHQGTNNLWLIPSAGAQGELSVHYATGSIDVGAGYEWEEGSGDNSNIVENPGIDRVNPIWKVPGPATNPTLTNITTGQTISWIGSVAAGETLTVDLNNQTAELGGTNVFSQLSGDWLALAPGANRLEYSATGATQGCTLEWNGVVG